MPREARRRAVGRRRECAVVAVVRVALTGAGGLVGRALADALLARSDELTVISRDPERALSAIGRRASVEAHAWEPLTEAAPVAALAGRDAVVHLAGEPIAQRWTRAARRRIRESRVRGTENLIAGLRAAGSATDGVPPALLSASAIGYYGARGDEPLDEEAPPGEDFLARVCVEWERTAQEAGALGIRVVLMRTGVVLARWGGALARMLPPFRLGLGGPVAGGRQFVSWVHPHDLVAIALAALRDERWEGAFNITAPHPVRNGELAHELGRALARPAFLPLPGAALRARYGRMATIITTGARVLPARALVLDYRFRHPHLGPALRAVLDARPADGAPDTEPDADAHGLLSGRAGRPSTDRGAQDEVRRGAISGPQPGAQPAAGPNAKDA